MNPSNKLKNIDEDYIQKLKLQHPLSLFDQLSNRPSAFKRFQILQQDELNPQPEKETQPIKNETFLDDISFTLRDISIISYSSDKNNKSNKFIIKEQENENNNDNIYKIHSKNFSAKHPTVRQFKNLKFDFQIIQEDYIPPPTNLKNSKDVFTQTQQLQELFKNIVQKQQKNNKKKKVVDCQLKIVSNQIQYKIMPNVKQNKSKYKNNSNVSQFSGSTAAQQDQEVDKVKQQIIKTQQNKNQKKQQQHQRKITKKQQKKQKIKRKFCKKQNQSEVQQQSDFHSNKKKDISFSIQDDQASRTGKGLLRNCKCCGKLIDKLCFKCPHLYCNQSNCKRKKKRVLNERMLERMKQEKIQEHYRQRQMYQKMRKAGKNIAALTVQEQQQEVKNNKSKSIAIKTRNQLKSKIIVTKPISEFTSEEQLVNTSSESDKFIENEDVDVDQDTSSSQFQKQKKRTIFKTKQRNNNNNNNNYNSTSISKPFKIKLSQNKYITNQRQRLRSTRSKNTTKTNKKQLFFSDSEQQQSNISSEQSQQSGLKHKINKM